jgi:hypothetical protein
VFAWLQTGSSFHRHLSMSASDEGYGYWSHASGPVVTGSRCALVELWGRRARLLFIVLPGYFGQNSKILKVCIAWKTLPLPGSTGWPAD